MPGRWIVCGRKRPLAVGIHAHQEFGVRLRFAQTRQQELHRVGRIHVIQDATQDADPFVLFRIHQHFFTARAAGVDVHGRPNAAVDQLAVKHDLLIAGPFELFKDHVIHFAAGVDQRRRDNRQRAPFFDLASRTEEPFGTLQRVGVESAGEELARRWAFRVPGASQTRDRVEEDHHVGTVLDHPLRLFDHHLRHLHVARRRFVEGGADDLAIRAFDLTLHVSHFFRAFVDQQDDDVGVGIVFQDCFGHLLHQDGLAGARRTDDQTALAEADRDDQVDHARCDFVGVRLHPNPVVGMQRGQIVELHLVGGDIRILVVDRFDAQQREIAFVFFRRTNLPRDDAAGFHAEATNLARRNVNIVRAREVVVVWAAQKAEAIRQDLQRPFAIHQAVHLHAFFENAEDQLLAFDAGDFAQVFFAGFFDELVHRHFLQFGDMDLALLYLLVTLIVRVLLLRTARPTDQLLGQRHRLGVVIDIKPT
ncbi:hypothetical protein DSM3645_20507 [Blastopirellula marina DSM 3645]|uniref:Uncharacterized protein n=1 Tax=Blastopirellula marina DSM 3645 TaxID=314230 RepID=A3ZQQ3_9BACT|nr:hypothetical protein DSM3645_20507 [Blastopirellula marina DSM 3645]